MELRKIHHMCWIIQSTKCGGLFLIPTWVHPTLDSVRNFHFLNRNVNPIIFGIWEGKNSLFITQGTLIFPHSQLSSCGKTKIPHSRLRRSWEIFVSPRLLSYSWGNINVPFVIHREFLIPSFAASRLMKELSRPKFQK